MSWNFGLVSGQLTGGWLFTFSELYPIYLAIVLATINLAVLTLMIGPSPSVRPPESSESVRSAQDTSHQDLSAAFAKLAWLANLGGAFSMSMVIHLLPKLAVELQVPANLHDSGRSDHRHDQGQSAPPSIAGRFQINHMRRKH